VAGLYSKRRPGKPFWLMTPKADAETDEKTGLLEVDDAPTGFMKINLEMVLPKIEARYPHLQFTVQDDESKESQLSWEYFPLGVEGPRTPAARMERVKAALKVGADPVEFRAMIEESCYDQQPPSFLRGEDYSFCYMARQCGIPIYMDLGMSIIPHLGLCAFPITPEMVGVNVSNDDIRMEANK